MKLRLSSCLFFHAWSWKLLAACTVVFSSIGRHEVRCDLTYGNDGNELTLAIVNVTYVDPFTGFASNFRDDAGNKFTFSSGKIASITGLLVRVVGSDGTTNDACEPIDSAQWPSEPWIVLAKYGTCKDEQ